MNLTGGLLFGALLVAYIFTMVKLIKIEHFELDIYRDISEVYSELDELERKYKEMYHDNDDVK